MALRVLFKFCFRILPDDLWIWARYWRSDLPWSGSGFLFGNNIWCQVRRPGVSTCTFTKLTMHIQFIDNLKWIAWRQEWWSLYTGNACSCSCLWVTLRSNRAFVSPASRRFLLRFSILWFSPVGTGGQDRLLFTGSCLLLVPGSSVSEWWPHCKTMLLWFYRKIILMHFQIAFLFSYIWLTRLCMPQARRLLLLWVSQMGSIRFHVC